jgi:hypothetical protein
MNMSARAFDPSARTTHVRPWYRELWPWLLISGPALVVVGCVYAMWLAVATDDTLVAEDYYKRGLSINERLERAANAARMQIAAQVTIGADGGVRVALSGAAPSLQSVRLVLAHATRSGLDRSAVLERNQDNIFVGHLPAPGTGRWLLSVEADDWRLPAVEVSEPITNVRLRASP